MPTLFDRPALSFLAPRLTHELHCAHSLHLRARARYQPDARHAHLTAPLSDARRGAPTSPPPFPHCKTSMRLDRRLVRVAPGPVL